MYEVFTKLLNMSLTASLLVIAVILLRILLKKVPKRSICILWVLVAFRLIVPFSITSSASVFNVLHMGCGSAERMEYFQYNGKTEKPTLTFDLPSGEYADVYQGMQRSESTGTKSIGSPEGFEPAPAEGHTAKIYLPAIMMIWVLGVAAILSYALISFFALRKNVAASIPETGNIYICDEIKSPFILGIVRPRIYLPSGLEEGVKGHVIAHEQAHLKRFDHLWKPIGFLLLAVYWFNPILWLAYVLFCRDIEAACDEKVIEDFDRQWKVKYSEALLSCAVERRMITICPLAFGETNVKGRVKGVLNYKKPAFWVTVVTAIICVIMAIVFLTNPKNADDPAADLSPSKVEAKAAFCRIQTVHGFTHAIEEETIQFGEITYRIDDSNELLAVADTGNIRIPSGSSAVVYLMKGDKEAEFREGDVVTVLFSQAPVERLQISMQGQELEITDNAPVCTMTMPHGGNAELIIRNLSSEMVTISAHEETEQIVEVSAPPGWMETVLNDSFYEDRIFVEVSRVDFFLRAGYKMLGIQYGVNAYKSAGENPEYLEVGEPWVRVFGTDSGEYLGGLSAVVDDEGVIRFNMNGYVQLNCNGETTEDGVLDMQYLQKAGFQVRADNGEYSLWPRRSVVLAEEISTETVAVNQEMSDEEAEQLRSLAKDISLDDIEPDNYKVKLTCYDEGRNLQVILFNEEKDSCILATAPWSLGQFDLFKSGDFQGKLQSKPLEFLQTLGQVEIKDFSALLPEQKELDLYVGKTIRDLKKDGFMYSGYEYSGHIYRVQYGNRRYCYVVDFEGSDEYEDPEYVTEEEILSKTITKIEFEYFGIEMTSKVIFA